MDRDSMYEMLYRKGIKLSEEQKTLLYESFKNFKIICDDFQEVMNYIFQEEIKPIIDSMVKAIRDTVRNIIKIKLKYKPIKIIKPNSYFGLNKPKVIHCRNNC